MKLDLTGTWRMTKRGENQNIPCRIPGTMYSALLHEKLIPHPFYKDNAKLLKKLSYNDYDFTYDFQVTQELLDHDYIVLNCEGIDTIGTIVVNNQIIGNVENMHRTYRFDLKNFLIVGKNTITIKIDSPVLYAEHKQKEFFLWGLSDEMVMNGHAHIRKAHSMFGWDWGPQLPDMGIWRPIYIEAYDASRIKEVYITQVHHEKIVDISIETTFLNTPKSSREMQLETIISLSDEVICEEKRFVENESTNVRLTIHNPRLWWPNEYGEQPLYTVTQKLRHSSGEIFDELTNKIGLREINVVTPLNASNQADFYFVA